MTFKKVYKQAVLGRNKIMIDGKSYAAVEGKHCIWIPELEIKIPWTYNGKIEARQNWLRGRHKDQLLSQTFNDHAGGWNIETLESIQEEYRLFDILSQAKMTPPVDGFIYIENMISIYTKSVIHCDPMGAVGFYVKDANKLSVGEYDIREFKRKFIDKNIIKCSAGALGDLQKKNNTVNGYLIDIRRTIWDMMSLNHDYVPLLNWRDLRPIKEQLKNKVLSLGQFPHKARKTAYQTYWVDDHYKEGTRQTLYRFDKMGIEKDLTGQTVVDLGSQIGSVCAECYMRGARHVTGIEYESDYVGCARDLARYNGHQINYQCMNLMEIGNVSTYVNLYYGGQKLNVTQDIKGANDYLNYYSIPQPIDKVFLLSMHKHIGVAGLIILRQLNWKEAYIESNNCPGGFDHGQAGLMEIEFHKHFTDGYKILRLGMTEDRSPRCLWKIVKI